MFGSVASRRISFAPSLIERGYGRVVNVSSDYGSFGLGLKGPASYSVTKAALNALTRKLAEDCKHVEDVKVNAVHPGYIWSDKMEAYFRHLANEQGRKYEEVRAEVESKTALHHIPDSTEIADAVLFFASDLSRGCTGQALDVNGGHYFH